ncbi:hypothetical protein DL768_001389 [Monosporascus sp. mg162]|nr:hypothetical protein DL768_001389 [Monosporascus sp. mg162]
MSALQNPFDEFGTEAPSNINNEEVGESITALWSHRKGAYTATSIQPFLLDSLPTRLRMLHLLSGSHCEFSYLDVVELSSEVTDISRAYSNFVAENEGSGVIKAVPPEPARLPSAAVYDSLALRICQRGEDGPSVLLLLKASLDVFLAFLSPESDEGFSRLMAGGGRFREGISTGDLLKEALRDIISLAAERIRRGETNVKNHMLMIMVMPQTEAIEADTSCHPSAAQNARSSLEFCHGLLRTWGAASASLPSLNDMGLTSTSLDAWQEGYGLDLDLDFLSPGAVL